MTAMRGRELGELDAARRELLECTPSDVAAAATDVDSKN